MFGTSHARFLAFDSMGSALWVGAYAGLGYMCSEQLDRAVAFAAKFGTWMGLAVLLGVLAFVCQRFLHWQGFLRELRLARIAAIELKHKLDIGEKVVIVDLHGCPYHAAERQGIPGAIRINPHKLEQYRDFPIPHDWTEHDVVLYCACPNESTSARVALALHRRGVTHVRPLEGGLQAWSDLGFPLSSTIPVVTMSALRKLDHMSLIGTPTGEHPPLNSGPL
jgi:rhodanese-related sulfurtransferase